MMRGYWSRVEDGRQWKTNAFWCAHASAFAVVRSASTFNSSFLRVWVLSGTVGFSRSAAFGCLATLIFTSVCVLETLAFGMRAILMLPASLPLPTLSLTLSLKTYVLSLTFL